MRIVAQLPKSFPRGPIPISKKGASPAFRPLAPELTQVQKNRLIMPPVYHGELLKQAFPELPLSALEWDIRSRDFAQSFSPGSLARSLTATPEDAMRLVENHFAPGFGRWIRIDQSDDLWNKSHGNQSQWLLQEMMRRHSPLQVLKHYPKEKRPEVLKAYDPFLEAYLQRGLKITDFTVARPEPHPRLPLFFGRNFDPLEKDQALLLHSAYKVMLTPYLDLKTRWQAARTFAFLRGELNRLGRGHLGSFARPPAQQVVRNAQKVGHYTRDLVRFSLGVSMLPGLMVTVYGAFLTSDRYPKTSESLLQMGKKIYEQLLALEVIKEPSGTWPV